MKQVLFRIPGLGIPVFGFGLMVVLGVYLGTRLAAWRMRKEKLDPNLAYDLSTFVVVGGMIGARLFYVAEYWGETVTSVAEVFRVWNGGIVFYGSVFGAAAGFFLYRVFRAFPILATLDALAPSVALGVALGRVGCFFNGCCYGDVCSIPGLGVQFPRDSLPWKAERARSMIPAGADLTLPLHPTQLYSALDGLILLLLLSAYYPIRRRDGEVMALLMITYPITRFLIELLRDDEAALVSGFTIAQAVSLFLLAAGVLFWSRLSRRPAVRLADGSTEPTGS